MAIKTRYSLTTENIQPSGRAMKFVQMFAQSQWKLWETAMKEVELSAKMGQISKKEEQKLYREQIGSINRQIEDVEELINKVQNDELKAVDAIALKNVGKTVTTERPSNFVGGSGSSGSGSSGSVTYGNAGKLPPNIQAQINNIVKLGTTMREDLLEEKPVLTQTQVRDGIERVMDDNAQEISDFQTTVTRRSGGTRGAGAGGSGAAAEPMVSTTTTTPIPPTRSSGARDQFLKELNIKLGNLQTEKDDLGAMPTSSGTIGGIGGQGLIEETRDVYSQRFGGGNRFRQKQALSALGGLHDDFYNRELATMAPDPTNTELQAAEERARVNVNNFLNDELFPAPPEPAMVPDPTGVIGAPEVPAVRAGAEMPTDMDEFPEGVEELNQALGATPEAQPLVDTPIGGKPAEAKAVKVKLTPEQERQNDLASIIEMAQGFAEERIKENKPTRAQRKLNNEFKMVKELYNEAFGKMKKGDNNLKVLNEVGGAIDEHYQKKVKDGVMSEKIKKERFEALVMLNYLFIMNDKNASPVSK